MRLDNSEHLKNDWWVHDYAREHDLELLDLWQYPIAGGADDFERFLAIHDLEAMVAETSVIVRALFGLRMVLGRIFKWEDEGAAESMDEIYRDDREMVGRIENATVTALMHLAWAPLENGGDGADKDDDGGSHTAQLAVYATPKGRFGGLYMQAIGPFRHLFVYPALMKAGKKRWEARA
ncbi:MAG: DUF2867 domain-containing protein [Acidobacteriota bacterium]